ncbi:uncharacterized protein LOC125444331 [Sphaerodactylus townsendi]|uniref:uncharacterized protein LOC125444331 n=1 Tax=Sphaerodactylus townsendi TaxID=933632 RepID=UPI002026399A|nr:uncharacterized protein LOC125444331 [Sphaerodactylus townsendi]
MVSLLDSDGKLRIHGIQEDVENVLKTIHAKIEEYQAEWVEVMAQYEKVPHIFIEEFLAHGVLPADPSASSEILAGNPAAVVFRGTRQNVVELERRFKDLLGCFQVLPVSLTDLQSRFVKARWGSLFHKNFFWEQGVAALLEISGDVQVSGLDLGTVKKAEGLLSKHVCEKTLEIPEEVKWATESEEWQNLLHRLKSHQEVALYNTSSSLVFMVGICPHITQAEQSMKEYLEDHSQVEESLNVARPKLALAGENLLHIMDWDHLEVKIRVQPHSQILSLKVSGIQKLVQKAVQVIKTDLDSLVLGKVPLNKVALGEYFSGAGADALNQMAPKCVARLEIRKRPGRGDEVASNNGHKNQGLAETCWAVIFVVGRKSDVSLFKQEVAKFLAKFYEETVCSSEIPTFSNEVLRDLSKNIPHQFPVAVRHPRETAVQVCGSRKDVDNFLEAIYAKIKEATQAKIQKDNGDWLESKLLHNTIRWHYRTDAGWSAFDAATNCQLEKAYQKKKTNTKLQWEGKEFQINWLKSEAFMPSCGVTYKLWREVCLWDKNITPHWEAMDQCLVKKVELQRSSEEYQDIVKNFNRMGNSFKILKVERIQNRYLWVSYCWKRSWMEKKNPERVQNERILYHGMPPENCRSIQEFGFKSACRKGSRYGQGIYFAEDAARAALYTKLNSCGHRLMFQSRVLTGEYTCGKETMAFPPMKPGERGCYDSLVDAPSKPAIFVIFFDDYAYPEYLITFRESPP